MIRNRKARRSGLNRPARLGFRPALDEFEKRELLTAVTPFLQGTAFIDTGSPIGGPRTTSEAALPGATVILYQGAVSPANFVASTTTDINGGYVFDSSNVPNGLTVGATYSLVESAMGYTNTGTQAISQIDPVTFTSTNTIQVTVVDPNAVIASFDNPVSPYDRIGYTLNSVDGTIAPTQLTFTLGGTSNVKTSPFPSLCVGINDRLDFNSPYPSVIDSQNALGSNGGEIAYLYNHYGTTLPNAASLPSGLQSISTKNLMAGVQLAIWELEYGSAFALDGYYDTTYTSSQDYTDLQTATTAFLTDAEGKSEKVAVIDASLTGSLPASSATPGGQSILAGASFNFGNQLTITPAVPTIVTSQQPASAIVGASIADKATVSGGYSPTGTVTFNLYNNKTGTGPALFTDTETLSGGVATSKGYTATATATDYWVATYNSDANNQSVSSGLSDEPVTITPAVPTIVTSQQPASAIVGASIADKATVSGGYSPTGTVTFNLYNNKTGTGPALFTDTETLSGGVATSKGYTATATATDYWVATYNSDANNQSVSSGLSDEPVTITPAVPTIVTQAGGAVTMGGISISGAKYQDLTGNGFSSDDTRLGGVTINLYSQANGTAGLQPGSDVLVATTKTASDGTFSFNVSSPGTYFVQESVPQSSIQTGGGPNGSAGNTYYTIVAKGGQSYSGNLFDDYQIPTCTPTNVCYTVTTPSGHSTTVSDLSGNTAQGDTVTVTFTVPKGMSDQLTLVSYVAPSSSWSDSNAYQQVIYQPTNGSPQVATGTFCPGTYKLTVMIPNSYYQIDFICGQAINQFEPNQSNTAYGPDGANITYHAEGRFIDSDNGGTKAAWPMPAPTPNSPLVPLPTPSPTTTLTDTAMLSGAYTPTGTITFYLIAPGGTLNTKDSTSYLYADTVPVNGNGSYSTSTGSNPGGYAPTAAGTYQWVAIYSGDTNNATAHDQGGKSEMETVGKASPSISTVAGGTVTCGGSKMTDTATLSGGVYPTGTITFTLTSPSGNVVNTETVCVTGDGTYTTPKGYTPTAAGTYTWSATYNGDTSNTTASDNGQNESETVCPPSVCKGQTQSCSYWCGSQGQSLINCLNGGSRSQSLGNWLASTCPNLFGNLKGCSNSQVASYCKSLGNGNSNQQACAQVLSTALCAYVTNSNLAGNSGQSYGFSVSNYGLGACGWNVGSCGSGIGLSNNQSYCIDDVLSQIDGLCSRGSINSWSVNSVNSLCSNLNQY